jgi:DNA-binding IclR family transcriptional regulator
MRKPVGSGSKAPAVAKAVSLLDSLARSGEPATISGLARRIEVPKSSVADICVTLSNLGLLSRDRDGRYLLGQHIVELARGLVGGRRLIEVFADACMSVPDARDETVTMSILDGADTVIIAVRHGRLALPLTARVGLRLPVWSTASGRCFLGALSEVQIGELLALGSVTSAGVAGQLPTVKQFAADLTLERHRGFHVDDQATAAGMTSVSAPIESDRPRHVIASVAIATRTDTLSDARISELGAAAIDIAAACRSLSTSIDDV